jgi:hypothetical protein
MGNLFRHHRHGPSWSKPNDGVLDLLQASETVPGYTIRAWTGVATDEGVGLISMVEVDDARGIPVCRFEEFVADSVRRTDISWPREQDAAARSLQDRALDRARNAILGNALRATHGHRYDVPPAVPTD